MLFLHFNEVLGKCKVINYSMYHWQSYTTHMDA